MKGLIVQNAVEKAGAHRLPPGIGGGQGDEALLLTALIKRLHDFQDVEGLLTVRAERPAGAQRLGHVSQAEGPAVLRVRE